MQERAEKGKISVFVILEILILLFGTNLSIEGNVKILQYTSEYAWCLAFVALGIAFIGILIWRIRKKFTWILGVLFIIIYMFTAGFGYFVCMINKGRAQRLQYYSSKSVCAQVDGVMYSWDGKSALYNSENLVYLTPGDTPPAHEIKVYIDDEQRTMGVYADSSTDNIYLEIYGGATGDYLILTKQT